MPIDWGMSFTDRRYHPAAFAPIRISLSEKYQSMDELNFPDRMRTTSQILNKKCIQKMEAGNRTRETNENVPVKRGWICSHNIIKKLQLHCVIKKSQCVLNNSISDPIPTTSENEEVSGSSNADRDPPGSRRPEIFT
jgi:hypothetical protein